jgi:hypothetical protein
MSQSARASTLTEVGDGIDACDLRGRVVVVDRQDRRSLARVLTRELSNADYRRAGALKNRESTVSALLASAARQTT